MTDRKRLAIYPVIFVLGMSNFWLIYMLWGDSPYDVAVVSAVSAGLAASIAAWFVRKPYQQALADDRRITLYGWLLLGVLLAHLLIGFLIMLIDVLLLPKFHSINLLYFITVSLSISLILLPLGFVQNMLLGAALTEFLRRKAKGMH